MNAISSSSVTTVEFTLDTDFGTATNDVRNTVSGVPSTLPVAASASWLAEPPGATDQARAATPAKEIVNAYPA